MCITVLLLGLNRNSTPYIFKMPFPFSSIKSFFHDGCSLSFSMTLCNVLSWLQSTGRGNLKNFFWRKNLCVYPDDNHCLISVVHYIIKSNIYKSIELRICGVWFNSLQMAKSRPKNRFIGQKGHGLHVSEKNL